MEHTGSFHSAQEQIGFIQNYYAKADADPLFIIIHNLDGPMLRGEKTQAAMSQLATAPKIHLLASIDHINAPLGKTCVLMFSFIHIWLYIVLLLL